SPNASGGAARYSAASSRVSRSGTRMLTQSCCHISSRPWFGLGHVSSWGFTLLAVSRRRAELAARGARAELFLVGGAALVVGCAVTTRHKTRSGLSPG